MKYYGPGLQYFPNQFLIDHFIQLFIQLIARQLAENV